MCEFRGYHNGEAEELRLIDCFGVSLLTGRPFTQDMGFQQVELQIRFQIAAAANAVGFPRFFVLAACC